MTKHILMIKKSMNTGLMYLCKTTTAAKRDPYDYNGSGKYWLRHIKKHKSHIVTCIVGEYNTKEELKASGAVLSEQLNVVESDDWANLVPERGDGGWINNQTGNTWTISEQGRENMRLSRQANKDIVARVIQELIPKISGGNNYQSSHYIFTPWGKFETYREALSEAKRLRQLGRKDVVTDKGTLRKYCESSILLNKDGRRTFPKWRGNYTKQLGFYKEAKDGNSKQK